MATKGTAWVLRRCTDLLPYLLVMAVRERCRGPYPEPLAPAWPVPSAALVARAMGWAPARHAAAWPPA